MISERDIVYITKKQASVITAMLSVLCMLIFVGGYFWGKQSVLSGFGQKVAQDSAQDRVDYLMTMQSFMEKTKQDTAPVESGVDQGVKTSVGQVAQETELIAAPLEVAKNVMEQQKKPAQNKAITTKKYHAILIGFGTRAAAMSFVNRLKNQGISVEIKPRVSKSASGKVTRTWYQVVTKSYDSKDELMSIVNKIKKLERIKDHDIKII